MSVLIPNEMNLLVSSDPLNGAINRTTDGSSFEILLDDPIVIPKDAKNITIESAETSVWFTTPNIVTGVNDKFYFTDTSLAPPNYILTIPQGLYDLESFESAIHRLLENEDVIKTTDPNPVIAFDGDLATGKVELIFNSSTAAVDFTQANTPREILGFDAKLVTYSGSNLPHVELGDNVAAFNTINSFLLHCDITQRGIQINNSFNQTIAQVLIGNAEVGDQINSSPRHPAKITCSELAGNPRKRLRIWLTDEKNNLINTNGEYYTSRIVIRYLLPLVVHNTRI